MPRHYEQVSAHRGQRIAHRYLLRALPRDYHVRVMKANFGIHVLNRHWLDDMQDE
jgi:hypothetical protein